MRRYGRTAPKYPQPRTPHDLVVLDLGKRKVGVAIFSVTARGHSELYAAGKVMSDGTTDDTVGKIRAWVSANASNARRLWVCELPVVYKKFTKVRKDIQTLIDVHEYLTLSGTLWSETYSPVEWKGNVPKRPHHARLKAVLSPPELEIYETLNHDGRDAVGIGLFALARTRVGGVKI